MGGYVGTLLGTQKNTAGDPFRTQQENDIARVTGQIPAYEANANAWNTQEAKFAPQYSATVQNYGDNLAKSTTDQARQQYIANATGNVARAYQTGQANTQDELAARGLGGSSGATGAIVAGDNARAGAVSGAANEADQYFLNQHNANLGQLASLYGGATQQALGNYNTESGMANQAAEYGAGEEGQLANQAYANQQAQTQAAQAGFGDILQAGGEIAGMAAGVPPIPKTASQQGLAASQGVKLNTLDPNYGQAPTVPQYPDYTANQGWG